MTWSPVLQNIILFGGLAQLRGIDSRLREELHEIFGKDKRIVVCCHPRKNNASWFGGSLIAKNFDDEKSKQSWISRRDWNENPEKCLQKLFL